MLGDAGAMSVDVFTYLCNLYSERMKRKYGKLDDMTRFVLEVGIPTFSVCSLLGVTAWITYDAVYIITHPNQEGNINVAFLFGFASGNACVDIISSYLFYLRRRDVLKNLHITPIIELYPHSDSSKDMTRHERDVNLNMASALTHVSGDSLRTSSVFIAAMVAVFSDFKSSLCDAWAAIAVTATIVFIVIPLVHEIYQHAKNHPFFAAKQTQLSTTFSPLEPSSTQQSVLYP